MITPKIPLLKDGQILSVDVFNSIIKRTEYAGDLLKQYKLIAGNEMYVEPHYDGTRVSYLQPVGGGGTGETGQGGTVFISVIDESSQTFQFLEAKGRNFISKYGNQAIFVLIPTGSGGKDAVKTDAYPYALWKAVNRDNGIIANATDWFEFIFNYKSLGSTNKIQLAIDNSGSMTIQSVRASYNLFKARLQSAGFPSSGIVEPAMVNEDWIGCHL